MVKRPLKFPSRLKFWRRKKKALTVEDEMAVVEPLRVEAVVEEEDVEEEPGTWGRESGAFR